MKPYRKTARYTGTLFLTAMAASLIGGSLLETMPENSSPIVLIAGVTLEIVNALAVLGVGLLLFPVLKTIHPGAAKSYLGLRLLESLACAAAPLSLAFGANISDLRIIFTGILIPLFFCSGALVLYWVLYKYHLLPRFISIWGFIGVTGIVVLNTFSIQTNLGMILAFPIILNEIFLGIWLITKGFKPKNQLYHVT
ncbi:DUF4386 domain-containing protein [Maribellus maritimus]|uniref:DUF4386 domain-containing protein n=1 Tax=Maribellus maritimus TaxID=2870838 RepID=UPI001EECF385|nr:DUF4386 domain-containing protein [Maribellus maritimus]MCG6189888.1 DUF4386 domain-containing protein [Maribellus maritimus]